MARLDDGGSDGASLGSLAADVLYSVLFAGQYDREPVGEGVRITKALP